ncbi:MAG TPA: hypothetical protein VGN88_05075 [Phycisphaerae bacterium]
MVANTDALEMAKYLAEENRKDDPSVKRVVWFPDGGFVRLVVLSEDSPISDDGSLHPFYYRASPAHRLPLPSGVAIIRPDEYGKLSLPADWGTWDTAQDV